MQKKSILFLALALSTITSGVWAASSARCTGGARLVCCGSGVQEIGLVVRSEWRYGNSCYTSNPGAVWVANTCNRSTLVNINGTKRIPFSEVGCWLY